MKTNQPSSILVIGGGIAGMTAALEAAEAGFFVILVEREAGLGGRVIRTHRYFPKMCPPTCGFEINLKRIRRNPRIVVHRRAGVTEISGEAGAFQVCIRIAPKTDDDRAGGDLQRDFGFNAATLEGSFDGVAPGPNPSTEIRYANVGAIIVATGWQPYDAVRLDRLGFSRLEDVITNVMMERLAAHDGPTDGVIRRPSDGKIPRSVAFVQCAGSRDDDHLPYCSAVCCMAALKQARYLLEQNSEIRIAIFYIDIRTVGRHERFYYDLLETNQVSFVKGKVAEITKSDTGDGLQLSVEDTLSGHKLTPVFDMAVLSSGMVPNNPAFDSPFSLQRDAYGFIDDMPQIEGIFSAGCAKHPCDVSRAVKDAAGAALKAIQCLRKRGAA